MKKYETVVTAMKKCESRDKSIVMAHFGMLGVLNQGLK